MEIEKKETYTAPRLEVLELESLNSLLTRFSVAEAYVDDFEDEEEEL